MKSIALTKEYIIKELSDNINHIKDSGDSMAITSWGRFNGVLITGNMAERIIELLTAPATDTGEQC